MSLIGLVVLPALLLVVAAIVAGVVLLIVHVNRRNAALREQERQKAEMDKMNIEDL